MAITVIRTKEYRCERCMWKWVRRSNGKDLDIPWHCVKCKTPLWNTPRHNNMLQSSFWLARKPNAKDYVKMKFLDLYNNKTDEEWNRIGKSIRDDMTLLVNDIMTKLN